MVEIRWPNLERVVNFNFSLQPTDEMQNMVKTVKTLDSAELLDSQLLWFLLLYLESSFLKSFPVCLGVITASDRNSSSIKHVSNLWTLSVSQSASNLTICSTCFPRFLLHMSRVDTIDLLSDACSTNRTKPRHSENHQAEEI